MFLSILIPVYNVEPYLPQCLDSILKSSFADYELLLIVGRSSDRSNEICDEYAAVDSRIRVIMQDGKGLSNARNCGLRAALGMYILYIDSDDFLDTAAFDHTIWKLYIGREKKFDVLISDFFLTDANGQVYDCRKQIKEQDDFIEEPQYLRTFLRTGKNFCNVWRYIYRRNFLLENHLFSKENYKSEDLDYSVRVLLSMKRYCFSHNPYYCYRVGRAGSLVNVVTRQNVDNLLDIIEENILLVENSKDFPYRKPLINKLVWEYFFNFLYIIDISPESDRPYAKKQISDHAYLLKYSPWGRILYPFIHLMGVTFWAQLLLILRKIKRLAAARRASH